MGHNLDIHDGKASMMYVGQEPWHGLGTRLDRPATAEEAIRAASMDWQVEKVPLFAHCEGCEPVRTDRFGVFRTDRGGSPEREVLGVVTKAYNPLQNREAFGFFDPIVGKNAAVYHTAGALDGGRRVWILAKLPDCIRVAGDDIAEKYLLLANSHDGTSAVQVKFTPVRVVCQNTLTLALGRGRTLRVPHTKNMARNLNIARDNLGIIHSAFEGIEEAFKRMAGVQVNADRLKGFLGKVFPSPADPADRKGERRAQALRERAAFLFDEGQGNRQKGVEGTLWAAYNGVTESVDQYAAPRRSADQHLERVWFGEGYLHKARAYRTAVEMMRSGMN